MIAWFLCPLVVRAGDISVSATVESQDVYVGESFIMQVVVDGSDKAEAPDLSVLEGFAVEALGGSNESRQSISIINGRIERNVSRRYVYSYRLTPLETGRLTIPSVLVNVGGEGFRTSPIVITARKPGETGDFKLRMRLSRASCFIGEPVVLTVTWYLRRDVQDFRFTAPLLSSDAFVFENPEVKTDRSKRYYRIPFGAGEVIAEKGSGLLEGERYATLEFRKALIPKRAGAFVLPEIIVACSAVTGFSRGSDFFDDFFSDDFFGRRRGRLKKYVVSSNPLTLDVRDLPLEGRPKDFSGLVGEYRISATARPTEVNVGDPITLNIVIEGPDYLGAVDLPPLAEQPDLTRDFKIPDERADGRIDGGRKIFTQSVRAKHDGVEQIPPIRLAYFNTANGLYEAAATDPIPLVVHETRVVTAVDAEGIEPAEGAPVERRQAGIAYNYEGPAVIEPQDFGLGSTLSEPAWIAALITPPAAYFILLTGAVALKRRRARPEARKARGAMKRLRSRIDAIGRKGELRGRQLCEEVLEALREYIGDKLNRPGATITAGDLETILARRGLDASVIESLKEAMSACEAGAYAGGLSSVEGDLPRRVRKAAEELERKL